MVASAAALGYRTNYVQSSGNRTFYARLRVDPVQDEVMLDRGSQLIRHGRSAEDYPAVDVLIEVGMRAQAAMWATAHLHSAPYGRYGQ
jgi:hypothetical protein